MTGKVHDLTNGELELSAGSDRRSVRSVVILTVSSNGMSTQASPLGRSLYGHMWYDTGRPHRHIKYPIHTDFVDLRVRAQLRWGRATDPSYCCSAW